jgi:hypothetical protein
MNHPSTRLLACLLGLSAAARAHQHFAAGIIDANQNGLADAGESLCFAQGDPEAAVFHLLARPVGQRCGGHYMLSEAARTLFPADSFSIIALSDGQYELASPNHAATGSWIWVEIVSVSGPAGATFGFWEENSNTMTHALPANQATGNPRFVISEGIDDPAEDPFGHIHGRAWTANLPGDYIVGIRLVDLSTSGPGGGPWHQPSRIYQFHFTAGPSFQPELKRNASGGNTLTWQSRMGVWQAGNQTGIPFRIMRSTSLAADDWQHVGTVTGTTADTATFTDSTASSSKAFYRLEYPWENP